MSFLPVLCRIYVALSLETSAREHSVNNVVKDRKGREAAALAALRSIVVRRSSGDHTSVADLPNDERTRAYQIHTELVSLRQVFQGPFCLDVSVPEIRPRSGVRTGVHPPPLRFWFGIFLVRMLLVCGPGPRSVAWKASPSDLGARSLAARAIYAIPGTVEPRPLTFNLVTCVFNSSRHSMLIRDWLPLHSY